MSDGQPRQLALPFIHRAAFAETDFLAAPSNRDALLFLAPGREAGWPSGRMLVWGPPGIGKTHLLHVWIGRARARGEDAALLEASSAAALAPDQPLPAAGALAIDDVDQVAGARDEARLLHLLNRAHEAAVPLLMAAREAPSRLSVGLADLASRLAATLAVRLGTPEDALLDALLARLLAERQLAVPAHVARRLRLLLPREPDAIRAAVAALDRALLERGHRPTPALATEIAAIVAAAHDPQSSSPIVSPLQAGLLD